MCGSLPVGRSVCIPCLRVYILISTRCDDCVCVHMCVYLNDVWTHTRALTPLYSYSHIFFILMCGWTELSNPCMHASMLSHIRTYTHARKNSTVNEYTRTNTNALAYTRDTDRQTVLVMCAAGFSVLLSLLFVADSAIRIDFDGTHLQAKPSIFFLSLFFQQRKETKKKRNPT